jgi:hypothetical protein
MSNAIFVIDVLGYIGNSTAREMYYAAQHEKKIFYWSQGDLSKL